MQLPASLKKQLFRNTSNSLFWISAAFLIKGIIFICLLSKHNISFIPGFWGEANAGSDSPSYILPTEHLLKFGSYFPNDRMPGYSFLYLPFAALFERATACNIIILLQFSFAALSVYSLALISKYIFKSDTIFYITFLLYSISTYTSLYDSQIYSESFATSFFIFSAFYLVKYISIPAPPKRYLFLSGLCMTELIFLRPVFVPILVLCTLILLYFLIKQGIKPIAGYLLLFLLPFILIDGSWTFRNYITQKKIIPLYSTIPDYKYSYKLALTQFVGSWGGSLVWWDQGSEIRWFGLKSKISSDDSINDATIKIPEYIYTSKFNHDSLVHLKQEITLLNAGVSDSITSKAINTEVEEKCRAYRQSIKSEHPFLFYIKAPIILVKKFLINSQAYTLFSESFSQLSYVKKAIKLFYVFLYYATLLLGFIGMLLLIKKLFKVHLLLLLILSIVIYTIGIHVIIFRTCENRYFVPAFPFMLICAAYAITWIGSLGKKSGGSISVD